MPFYEYECPHCGKHEEVLQAIGEKPLKKCSSCGKTGLKKLMSAPVFRLKGSGWYETDFKSDQENKRNLAIEKEPDASTDAAKPDKVEKPEKVDKPDKPDKPDKSEKPASAKPVKAAATRKPVARKARPARKGRR